MGVMEGEEEDRVLLSTLGVTSAYQQDIERDIMNKARDQGSDNAAKSNGNLANKLRAVNVEIDAVRSAVDSIVLQSSSTTLQHALATDRLQSLIKTKAQLIEKQNLDEDDRLMIRNLIKEVPKSKRGLKDIDETSRKKSKRLKTVSVDDGDDFEAILNATSAGFVETERDELVRKGIFTPFHKLKGYERRIQEPGSSSRHMASEESNGSLVSSSIARAVQLMSEAAKARPTTKMLDPELVPKLDPPSFPFQRLQVPQTLKTKAKEITRKNRRPQPGKKYLDEEDLKSFSNGGDDIEYVYDEGLPFVTLEGGLKIPETIFGKLFDYQKVGVQWLWELHCQRAGGIIGDEMGLGKTIQILAFLAALHFSGLYKPSIIICPVTLLQQWKREAIKWYPGFRVELLHDSVQSRKKKAKSSDRYFSDSDYEEKRSSKSSKKWDSLINRVLKSESGLLITTYEQLRLHGDRLLDVQWGYAVLDEGHRIRNPNAQVTLVCKQLKTVHRIIMSGSPIQNKLSELWSLFDFVFPGKLGVLPVFEEEFSVPISVGGYTNATPQQVSTAYRCAVVLRDLIMPYLLRRMKADVDAKLPKKTEHVLFCSLTPEQRSVYRAFLASSQVEQILKASRLIALFGDVMRETCNQPDLVEREHSHENPDYGCSVTPDQQRSVYSTFLASLDNDEQTLESNKRRLLCGIDVMRKICNHPDLLERELAKGNPDYGNPKRSGKMTVVAQVLNVWKEQGHRVLLFSQTTQMLDIIESNLIALGYCYRRMDGKTPVKQRMALIDEFNNSNDIFVFILTTHL